ncbi:MAG: YhbY family RNA-binding protein [Myxococcota bacterium]
MPTAPDDPTKRLAGFQRRYLRGLANPRKALVQVGEGGVSDGVARAIDRALEDHELVKVRLHAPDDKKGLARELALRARAELCGLVGHTVILYRAHPDDPRIALPARPAPGDRDVRDDDRDAGARRAR